MAQAVDFKPQPQSGSSMEFLRLQPGEYQIRCVGNPVKFDRYYVEHQDSFRSAITDDSENCIVRLQYNLTPTTKYAINVIDREDGKLKIMEISPTVFNRISEWAEEWMVSPGGNEGCDFKIKVERPGAPKTTRYKIIALKQSPFTEIEKVLIKQKAKDLTKVFKPTPQSEIEKVLGLQ